MEVFSTFIVGEVAEEARGGGRRTPMQTEEPIVRAAGPMQPRGERNRSVKPGYGDWNAASQQWIGGKMGRLAPWAGWGQSVNVNHHRNGARQQCRRPSDWSTGAVRAWKMGT
jgi:hypothetical protein